MSHVVEPRLKHRSLAPEPVLTEENKTILDEVGERVGRIQDPPHYVVSSGTCEGEWITNDTPVSIRIIWRAS